MPVRTWLKLMPFLLGSASFFNADAQDGPEGAMVQVRLHRQKKEKEMRSAESPLLKKDKRKFKGLKYFPPNADYRVTASFVKTENPALFKMRTTTTRLPDYVKYGEVRFNLLGNNYVLEVYQSPDIIKEEGYADYLFIPFTDLTNGNETYDVGRYLEMRIPDSDTVVIDFNLCYNPYCSYNPAYSCPIPPQANHLPIEVKAGEKKFREH